MSQKQSFLKTLLTAAEVTKEPVALRYLQLHIVKVEAMTEEKFAVHIDKLLTMVKEYSKGEPEALLTIKLREYIDYL